MTPADTEWAGGRDTWSWQTIAQNASVTAALAGDLPLALELLASLSPIPIVPATWREGYEVLATALAGDVAHARAKAAAFVPAARQHSNVNWHAELALVAGVLAIREGDPATGVAVLETARHAPMSMPYYYGLARRFLHQAREGLDPVSLSAAKRRADQLTVESILDELASSDTSIQSAAR